MPNSEAQQWTNPLIEKIEPTPSGYKVSGLILYVYPDGHGNISLPGKDSRGKNISVPADNAAGMLEALARLIGEMERQARRTKRA